MEPRGCNLWQPVANQRPQKPQKQAKTIAMRCDQLLFGAHGKGGVDLRLRPTADARSRLDRTTVAHLGSDGASEMRADRRLTVSGDVRRKRQFRLSHAVSVGPCQVWSGYRLGLQAGGGGFESRTLHV
jgi:hypothetical protein